jgi:hypothetical protein
MHVSELEMQTAGSDLIAADYEDKSGKTGGT